MTLSFSLSAVDTSVANGCSIGPDRKVGIQKAEGGELHSSSAQRIMVE